MGNAISIMPVLLRRAGRLSGRIAREMRAPHRAEKSVAKRARDPGAFALLVGVGPMFAAGVLVGWLGGDWLDRRLGTSPVFVVVGVLLGMGAGFQELFRALGRISRSSERNKRARRPKEEERS